MRRLSFAVLGLFGALSCFAGGGAPASQGLGDAWGGAREDRILVGSFSEILGLAASPRYLYAAAPSGIAVRDRQFSRWLPPLSLDLGGAVPRPVVMAADPSEDAVWIGLDGVVIHYRPLFGDARRVYVPGTVDLIIFDRRDPTSSALVRSSGGWTRVASAGFAIPVSPDQLPPADSRIVPPMPEEIFRAYPSLRAFGGLMTRDASLRSFPVTAAAAAPDRGEVYLGTFGNGIFEVDPVFNRVDHLEYGLLSRSADALALASDGVWVAGASTADFATTGRSGLTFVAESLDEWRWLTDDRTPAGLASAIPYDLAVRDGVAWIGTDRGLVRMDTRPDGSTRSWSALHGLPDDRVLAVAPRYDGVWAGTARGLAFVTWPADASLQLSDARSREAPDARPVVGPPLLQGTAVRALLARGDSLWIGSDAGLVLSLQGAPSVSANSPSPAEPGGTRVLASGLLQRISGDARLARPIVAIAASDSELFVATENDVVALVGSRPRPSRFTAVDFGRVAPITSLAADARTLWVGGRRGVLVVDRESLVTRLVHSGGELPSAVTDLALAEQYAWLGTRDGILRVRRLGDGFPR
jgi:ligand-binding sensor domain-containing protein